MVFRIMKFPCISSGKCALEMTPLDVQQVYQTLAAGGSYSPLKSIRSVMNTRGDSNGLQLHWNSKLNKFYNLYSSTNLVDWLPHVAGTNHYADIPTSGLGTNVLSIEVPSEDHRYFKLEEALRPTP